MVVSRHKSRGMAVIIDSLHGRMNESFHDCIIVVDDRESIIEMDK